MPPVNDPTLKAPGRSEVEGNGAGSYAVPFLRAWAVGQAALCRYLPKGVVPAGDAAAVWTDLPVLWLAGDGDPRDPPSNLATVPSQEPDSLVAVMAAQEHVVGHLGCRPSVIAAIVDAGTTADLDASCLAEGPGSSPAFTCLEGPGPTLLLPATGVPRLELGQNRRLTRSEGRR